MLHRSHCARTAPHRTRLPRARPCVPPFPRLIPLYLRCAQKDELRRTNVDPTRVQQQVRRKVELARSLLLARISVILRRLHQQHPEKLSPDKVPRVAGAQGAMLLDRRAYLAAFLEVVDESNVDGEHAIWNQFCFDRLLVLDLDLSVSANGDYELQELVRLHNLRIMAAHGNTNLLPSTIRLLLSQFTRSERRTAVAVANASVALSRDANHLADLDLLQEIIVYTAKDQLSVEPHLTNAQRERVLEATLGNMDVIMTLLPWARRHLALLAERRRSSGGGVATSRRTEREYLLDLLWCLHGTVDPERPLDLSGGSEVARLLQACVIKVDDAPLSPEALGLKCFQYVTPGGSQPQLTQPGLLRAALPLPRQQVDKLVQGAVLLAVTLEPTGHGGGRYRWRWTSEKGNRQQVPAVPHTRVRTLIYPLPSSPRYPKPKPDPCSLTYRSPLYLRSWRGSFACAASGHATPPQASALRSTTCSRPSARVRHRWRGFRRSSKSCRTSSMASSRCAGKRLAARPPTPSRRPCSTCFTSGCLSRARLCG